MNKGKRLKAYINTKRKIRHNNDVMRAIKVYYQDLIAAGYNIQDVEGLMNEFLVTLKFRLRT